MATFTVTNTNNSGAGSLRQEILDANALSGKDIINFGGLFNDGLAHTISLTGSGLSITDDLTIQGTNPNLLTIKDDSASRVFDITSGLTAAINGLTITNKYSGTAGGGAISNEGVFTLSNSIVTGNTANDGGGIYNTGTLTVNHSTISENTATEGGGIFNEASLTLNFSTITHNTAVDGGGIENSYSNATITTVNYGTITGNTAEHAGGIDNSGSITLNHSSITHNTASDDGGGILNSGSLSVNYSNISSNIVKVSGSPDSFSGSGGGIFNYSGSLTLNHSTINDNTALNGGGIYMYITTDFDTVNLLVSNSSISHNVASFSGGGIDLAGDRPLPGTITVSSSTISGNSALKGDGGGICDSIPGTGTYDPTGAIIYFPGFNPKTITVTNSIITGNSSGADGGGIYNYSQENFNGPNSTSSTISVSNSIITGNSAGADGGGIYNLGILTLSNSIIHGNTAKSGGGGIYNGGFTYPGYKSPDYIAYGNLSVIKSIISDNSTSTGGGIYNYGTLSVSYSSISDNSATNYGGGIYNSSFNEFSLSNPDLNEVISRYNTFGIVNVSHSSINGNKAGTAGGGIYNDADQNFGKTVLMIEGTDSFANITYDGLGIVKVSDSTISDNQAHLGGGIYNNATLTVGNSIIKHNKAFGIELSSGKKESGKGGGIYNNSTYYATATLNYSTIACNFDTPQEDSTKFIKVDNLVGNFIKKGSLVKV